MEAKQENDYRGEKLTVVWDHKEWISFKFKEDQLTVSYTTEKLKMRTDNWFLNIAK